MVDDLRNGVPGTDLDGIELAVDERAFRISVNAGLPCEVPRLDSAELVRRFTARSPERGVERGPDREWVPEFAQGDGVGRRRRRRTGMLKVESGGRGTEREGKPEERLVRDMENLRAGTFMQVVSSSQSCVGFRGRGGAELNGD